MSVKPPAPRHKTEDSVDGLILSIPSKKNWVSMLFLVVWMFGWFLGETSAIEEVFGNGFDASNTFMIVWLTGWTIGGTFALFTLLWQLFGNEKIEVAYHSIRHSRILLIPILPKEYAAEHIKNLRATSVDNGMFNRSRNADMWGFGPGLLAFDYGSKTVRIGASIDEAEAKQILAEIQQRFPQYKN